MKKLISIASVALSIAAFAAVEVREVKPGKVYSADVPSKLVSVQVYSPTAQASASVDTMTTVYTNAVDILGPYTNIISGVTNVWYVTNSYRKVSHVYTNTVSTVTASGGFGESFPTNKLIVDRYRIRSEADGLFRIVIEK